MDGMRGYGEYEEQDYGPPLQGVPLGAVSSAVSAPHRHTAIQAPVAPQPRPMPMMRPLQPLPAQQQMPHQQMPHQIMPPLPPPQMPPPQMQGVGAVQEAVPMSHMLGMSVLLPAVGTIAGMKYAGMYGGLGGALGAGSLINAYRAVKFMLRGDSESDREATISGTYAVLGLGAAGYLVYRGLKPKSAKSKHDDDDDDDKVAGIK